MDHRLVAVSAKKKQVASVGSSFNGCVTIGKSKLSQRVMPSDKSELEKLRHIAKSALSGEPVFFYIDRCATARTIAMRWAILKGKKGSQLLVEA
jgi:hypothetical protein